jgi:hypothetical protein
MRIAILIVTAAVLLLCTVGDGEAYYGYGPWCAVQSIGFGTVIENCSMQSFEQCRLEVIAGNRGFCQPNPYWAGYRAVVVKPLKRKRRGSH